jgi:phosphatidylserine decarboxylase
MAYEQTTRQLITLLNRRKDLKKRVSESIKEAKLKEVPTLSSFFKFVNDCLTHLPTEEELMPSVRKFYYVLSKAEDDLLKKDKEFNDWICEFVKQRGSFMDTPESAAHIDTFEKNRKYKIYQYFKPPSGWMTFNQFLGRQIKPGKRPIEKITDGSVIVSPADSTFREPRPIQEDSTVTAKGIKYRITDLLKGSRYAEAFANGQFVHAFLGIYDYHRFHVPVAGKIKEIRKTPDTTWTHEVKKFTGAVKNNDDVGFQFTHTRTSVIIESPVGYVALIAVGMGHISSVGIIVDKGDELKKGDELGYFAFGGSDIILLFQEHKVKLQVKKDKHYLMGQQIGEALDIPEEK